MQWKANGIDGTVCCRRAGTVPPTTKSIMTHPVTTTQLSTTFTEPLNDSSASFASPVLIVECLLLVVSIALVATAAILYWKNRRFVMERYFYFSFQMEFCHDHCYDYCRRRTGDSSDADIPLNPMVASEPVKAQDPCCSVCQTEPRQALFLPCMHVASCTKCASKLSACPICRQPVVQSTRVFLA